MTKIVTWVPLALVFAFHAYGQENSILKVSGFADLQYEWSRAPRVNTFQVGDGAIYLSKTLASTEFMLDLPFRTTNSTNSALEIAGPRTQAFVIWKHASGMSVKGGQFDAIFGYEGNDGVDLKTVRQGLLFSMVPVVHLGLLSKYEMSDAISISLLLSNPAELGFKIAVLVGSMKASLGGLTNTNPGTGSPRNWLLEALYGMELGRFALDTDLVAKQDRLNAGARTQVGVGALVGFRLDADLILVTRIEHTHGAAADALNVFGWTMGAVFNLASELSLKANYLLESSASKRHGVLVAGVYRF